jgi:hypothetical protein
MNPNLDIRRSHSKSKTSEDSDSFEF